MTCNIAQQKQFISKNVLQLHLQLINVLNFNLTT